MADIRLVKVEKEDGVQVMIGHAGFIKTAEDLYEALAGAVPGMKFGLAFLEASGPCLVREEGNDPELVELAKRNALAIGAGHAFVIVFKSGYPINVNNAVKGVPEVVNIYCSTANPVEVVVAETGQGRSILGVVDGLPPKGVETQGDKAARRKFLRDIGYKM